MFSSTTVAHMMETCRSHLGAGHRPVRSLLSLLPTSRPGTTEKNPEASIHTSQSWASCFLPTGQDSLEAKSNSIVSHTLQGESHSWWLKEHLNPLCSHWKQALVLSEGTTCLNTAVRLHPRSFVCTPRSILGFVFFSVTKECQRPQNLSRKIRIRLLTPGRHETPFARHHQLPLLDE